MEALLVCLALLPAQLPPACPAALVAVQLGGVRNGYRASCTPVGQVPAQHIILVAV